MKLYYSPGTGSLATHIVLRETERRFDLERVDLATHRTARGLDYLLVNPKGGVPALEIGDEILTEAPAIMQYLADLEPAKRLAPPNGTMARYHLQEWLAFLSGEIDKPFSLLFERTTPESVGARMRGRLAERFEYVQNVLSDRGFLLGETFTIADAYLFVALQWADRSHIDLSLWPNLDDYEFKIAQRPSVLAAMNAEGVVGRHMKVRRSA